ncbi:MAG TPA: hypothetical protein PLH94_00600 [Fimbriimonadaceae bacterium]|nr:hypothetical protein [Fimbriimonadaceae bacterium]
MNRQFGCICVAVLLSVVSAAPVSFQQDKPERADLQRAKASAESFLADRGIEGGVRYWRDQKLQTRDELSAEFLTEKTWPSRFNNSPLRMSLEIGIITGDIKSYFGPKPVATGGRDLTRQQLEKIVRGIAKQRGVEHYETVAFDVFAAGDSRLDRSKPEGVAYILLREMDSGSYPVLDFGNTVRIQLGLKTGNLQTYSETRGFVKSKVPASRISAEDAKRIAVNRLRVPGDTNFRAISARLGWVVPDRPNPSKTPGKLEYEFAWDVRLTHDIQARIRASDGKFLGRWSWESTQEGMLERRKRSGLSPPARSR